MQVKYTDALELLVYFEKKKLAYLSGSFGYTWGFWEQACYDFYQMQKNFPHCNFWRSVSFLPASSEYVLKSAKSRNCVFTWVQTEITPCSLQRRWIRWLSNPIYSVILQIPLESTFQVKLYVAVCMWCCWLQILTLYSNKTWKVLCRLD